MAFIQIMETHTKRYDEVAALDQEWRKATEGRRTLQRSVVGRDRDDPDHYVILAFFDSYDSAMENSKLPETGEFAAKVAALGEGELSFANFEVIEDDTD
ncbi:MAG TPA: hypothetical protein VGJ03_18070 [Acidimicrobiales bacterium]|jgi:hypothetical protein